MHVCAQRTNAYAHVDATHLQSSQKQQAWPEVQRFESRAHAAAHLPEWMFKKVCMDMPVHDCV